MEIEQLSITDLDRQIITFSQDLEHGRIYPKIDWLTLMIYDTTINHVLRFLGVVDDAADFLSSRYVEKSGYATNYVFSYHYINIKAVELGFYNTAPGTPLFDVHVPAVRVDLGGQALDYLRGIGFEVYDKRFSSFDFGKGEVKIYNSPQVKCTRVDWAFDFIDYKPEILDQLIDFCINNQLPSGRVPMYSSKGAIQLEIRQGHEKILYLGARSAEKKLRVYDKKLQCFNSDTGLWSTDPYGDPDSWIRFEWQLRNDHAMDTLFGYQDCHYNDYKNILRRIFDDYRFGDASNGGPGKKREELVFWHDFLPWSELEGRIIQNANYVLPIARSERVIRYIEKVIRNVGLYIMIKGRKGLEDEVNKMLRACDECHDLEPGSHSRDMRAALFALFDELASEGYHIPHERDGNGFFIMCGRIFFSLTPEKYDFELLDDGIVVDRLGNRYVKEVS